MKGRIGTALFAASLLAAPAAAQHTHPMPQYADRERSGIAALTPQQLDELRNGMGMGMALPAELNHFPGPKHALEWADSLGLTETQRTRIEAIRSTMSEEAIQLGEQVIEAERQLDQRFAHAHIDSATLAELTARIADLYGRLRYTHLAAHIETRALLTPAQIEAYDRVRGYGGG
ncbi:MAG: Spy/CpxP family protein refolding chaperone [Gemmatimonadota bacterium]|jgi:Spy/CpxP family protein refolding chaperone